MRTPAPAAAWDTLSFPAPVPYPRPMLNLEIAAVVLINLALVFYSLGVWAEHLKRYLPYRLELKPRDDLLDWLDKLAEEV